MGLALENKDDQKVIKGTTKLLVATLDISLHICMSPGTGQTMASPPPAELSPGPLRMSDLDPSTPTTSLTTSDLHRPPRKLDPISSGGKKKRTRKRRTKREAREEDGKKEGDSLREGQQMVDNIFSTGAEKICTVRPLSIQFLQCV